MLPGAVRKGVREGTGPAGHLLPLQRLLSLGRSQSRRPYSRPPLRAGEGPHPPPTPSSGEVTVDPSSLACCRGRIGAPLMRGSIRMCLGLWGNQRASSHPAKLPIGQEVTCSAHWGTVSTAGPAWWPFLRGPRTLGAGVTFGARPSSSARVPVPTTVWHVNRMGRQSFHVWPLVALLWGPSVLIDLLSLFHFARFTLLSQPRQPHANSQTDRRLLVGDLAAPASAPSRPAEGTGLPGHRNGSTRPSWPRTRRGLTGLRPQLPSRAAVPAPERLRGPVCSVGWMARPPPRKSSSRAQSVTCWDGGSHTRPLGAEPRAFLRSGGAAGGIRPRGKGATG